MNKDEYPDDISAPALHNLDERNQSERDRLAVQLARINWVVDFLIYGTLMLMGYTAYLLFRL